MSTSVGKRRGSQATEQEGAMASRANVWGQKSKIIKGKEKKERGQRGTCAPRCFICSGCRGRITSLRHSRSPVAGPLPSPSCSLHANEGLRGPGVLPKIPVLRGAPAASSTRTGPVAKPPPAPASPVRPRCFGTTGIAEGLLLLVLGAHPAQFWVRSCPVHARVLSWLSPTPSALP